MQSRRPLTPSDGQRMHRHLVSGKRSPSPQPSPPGEGEPLPIAGKYWQPIPSATPHDPGAAESDLLPMNRVARGDQDTAVLAGCYAGHCRTTSFFAKPKIATASKMAAAK